MALLDHMEQRLLNWARWKLLEGSGVLGYAAVNMEHLDMPREPYADAPIPTSNIEASETNDAVVLLPSDLQLTVEVHYLANCTASEKLRWLGISKATLYVRIERAQRMLSAHFSDRQAHQRAERERVQALQDSMRPA